jgi:rhamnulose-1-phosphate aldolase
MQSEARLILPEGAALLPYHLPGSLELGLASAEAVCHHFVVLWRMHGALATGQTLSQAVDYLEVVDKAARIYWTVAGAGRKPIGMSDEDIQTSLKKFGRWERFKRD